MKEWTASIDWIQLKTEKSIVRIWFLVVVDGAGVLACGAGVRVWGQWLRGRRVWVDKSEVDESEVEVWDLTDISVAGVLVLLSSPRFFGE